MKSILSESIKIDLTNRINLLSPKDAPLWGKMNVNEMVCHISDALRLAAGKKHCLFVGSFISKTLLKWLVLNGMPIPKGKVNTSKEMRQGGGGTPPSNLADDKLLLLDLINNFCEPFTKNKTYLHPAFGNLTKKEWARLAYIHIDYHLKQFGK